MGGELSSLRWEWGGYSRDVDLVGAFLVGGELGGVIWFGEGIGPGGQNGICLFGTGVEDRGVLRVSDAVRGGGVFCRRIG
jgi:hypothetical protein